jgi:hypothetical protein
MLHRVLVERSVVKPSVRRAIVVLAVLSVAAIVAITYPWVQSLSRDPRPSVLGVRLGMTADEVRARVDEAGPSEWSSSVVGGDWVLESHRGPRQATFEIHEGQLVAIRVEGPTSSDLPTDPDYEETPGSVLVRRTEGDTTRITLLSRACPTHRDEAERLVAEHAAMR